MLLGVHDAHLGSIYGHPRYWITDRKAQPVDATQTAALKPTSAQFWSSRNRPLYLEKLEDQDMAQIRVFNLVDQGAPHPAQVGLTDNQRSRNQPVKLAEVVVNPMNHAAAGFGCYPMLFNILQGVIVCCMTFGTQPPRLTDFNHKLSSRMTLEARKG